MVVPRAADLWVLLGRVDLKEASVCFGEDRSGILKQDLTSR